MKEKVYPVLDKFTYSKKHQTDYTYDSNRDEVSENCIAPRLMYRCGSDLMQNAAPFEICDCSIPKNSFAVLDFNEKIASLAGCTGFAVEYECDGSEGFAAVLRISFFDGEDGSFMSICPLTKGRRTVLFSTGELTFPERIVSLRAEVLSQCNAMHLKVTVHSLRVMNALDPLFLLPGQLPFYTAQNGTLTQEKDGLVFYFRPDGEFCSPEFPDSSDTVCNMLMPRRNTVFLALVNNSPLAELTLAYRTTTHDEWCEKTIPIVPYSPLCACYFNLSDTPNCDGRLRQLRICTHGASGALCIRRYTFEQEKRIETLAGHVESCIASNTDITVSGSLSAAAPGAELRLYQTDLSDEDDGPDGKELVVCQPAEERFTIQKIPLVHRGITRLSAQFLLLLKTADGRYVKVDDRFIVQNAAEFVINEFAFEVPRLTVDCCDFNACGNAVDDDTAAIQSAIDSVAARGGGRVLLRGDDSFYGRRYVVTNLLLRSRVELVIEKGAVLWQSPVPTDYVYRPTYGHDGVIEGINWTHSMHICNLPILQAHNCECVKVSGRGKIRSMDTGSEEGVDMPTYSTGCPDRIHQISIGFFNVQHVNLENFEIVRANNYHMSLYHCSSVSVIGVKMYEAKCVSGDGIGLGCSHHVHVANVFFQSNDDAVTITSHYHDPRGILWWYSVHDGSCATAHVLVEHCYLNSGGGKCIALIPWGTTQRYGERAEIHDIEVRDCCLASVSPVGAWADNPYWGRMPFDNAETNDYSPVKDVYIHNNRTVGNCSVYPLEITNLRTDCDMHGAGHFLNGDFSLGGFANWDWRGKVEKYTENRRDYGCILDGRLSQGLYLEAGDYTLSARLSSNSAAQLFAQPAGTAQPSFSAGAGPQGGELAFTVAEAGLWYLGVEAHDRTVVYSCSLSDHIDRARLEADKKAAYRRSLEKDFLWNPSAEALYNATDGKLYLQGDAHGKAFELTTARPLTDFEIEAAIRVNSWYRENGANSYGFVLRGSEGESCRMEFNESKKELAVLRQGVSGEREILYRRTNFFFTSNDYHHYRLRVQGDALTFWIDNAKYATVHGLPVCAGCCTVYANDVNFCLRQLALLNLEA